MSELTVTYSDLRLQPSSQPQRRQRPATSERKSSFPYKHQDLCTPSPWKFIAVIPWIICLMLTWSVGILATMCKSLYKTEICFSITHIMKSVENKVFFVNSVSFLFFLSFFFLKILFI
uniref:Uncharacterized protein n=1 Tax=Mustela putorius furo TaxID=9669 RepID=M3Y531_MUSPF